MRVRQPSSQSLDNPPRVLNDRGAGSGHAARGSARVNSQRDRAPGTFADDVAGDAAVLEQPQLTLESAEKKRKHQLATARACHEIVDMHT